MRGDHLVRHLHKHTDLISVFMRKEQRKKAIARGLPVVGNRSTIKDGTHEFAMCLACNKGATYWTHTLPYQFHEHHKAESPKCFTREAFEKVKWMIYDEAQEELAPPAPVIAAAPPSAVALTPSTQAALDAALTIPGYEGDDEEEDSLDEKVARVVKAYNKACKESVKRLERNEKLEEDIERLRDEVDITRDMMKLYRKAAVRYRRGERFHGIKRSIAIARVDLSNVRGGAAESSSGTEDLSSESDRST